MTSTTYARHRERWLAQLEGMAPLAALKQRTLIDAIDAEYNRRKDRSERLRTAAVLELERAESHPHSSAVYLQTLRALVGKPLVGTNTRVVVAEDVL